MRSSAAIAALCCVASACGGNYSNADVEFAAAVPRRSDVTVSMPLTSGLSSSGLRVEGGPSSRLGEASDIYAETKEAAAGLDQLAGFFIQILEAATRHDPTVRTPELRIWGPFDSQESPGWELQLLITRQPVQLDSADPNGPQEGFGWQIQYKEKTAADWRHPALVEGLYEPGEIRRGRGGIRVHVAEFRASGMATARNLADLGTLALLELGYDTRVGQPHSILMKATNDAAEQVGVGYQELPSGAGQLIFDITQADPRAQRVLATSRWTAEAAGRADLAVVSGSASGARAVQCWDAQQRVVFASVPWELILEGSESSCAFGAP